MCCLLLLLCPDSLAAEIDVTAKAALLLDSESGAVLWEKQGYLELPPASTTKILTALLALDICPTEREVEVSAAAAAVGESNVGLLAGERFRLGELLDAALLKSANDACYAIAEGVVGSEPFFVRLMNLKADGLGAGGARLCNTNGLPNDEHLMSCYDLAILARYALQNAEFAERVGSKYGKMEGGSYNRELKNTNKLLFMNEHVNGVKTGTTNAAGACLVSSMVRDGRSVIAVVLGAGDRYGDSLKLLNSGIDDYEALAAVKQGAVLGAVPFADGKAMIWAAAANDVRLCLPNDFAEDKLVTEFAWRSPDDLGAVNVGDLLGTLYFSYQGREICSVNLVSTQNYQQPRGVIERILAFVGWQT